MSDSVSKHYQNPNLLAEIRQAILDCGLDLENLRVDDLSKADEFHIGGRQATQMILDPLEIGPETKMLDIGCGIGGAARYAAHRYGCQVTGVDVTPSFIETAIQLTRWAKLEEKVSFAVSSPEKIPLPNAQFDLVTMFHVAMNVKDKTAFFQQVVDLLVPGGKFVIFDVVRSGKDSLNYPVPWASSSEIDFSAAADQYKISLQESGLTILKTESHLEFAKDFFQSMKKKMEVAEESGDKKNQALNLRPIVGSHFQQKMKNMMKAVEAEVVFPMLFLAEKN